MATWVAWRGLTTIAASLAAVADLGMAAAEGSQAMSGYTVDRKYQARVRKFYELLARRYGSDPVKRLGWDSRAVQVSRFEVLCDIGPLQGRSILDAGCGLGDLYGYLTALGYQGHYIGYDLVPAHCQAATAKYGDHFVTGDILETTGEREFDYVLASGLFGVPVDDWEAMVSATLERMFALCRIGMAVNFLSVYSDPPADGVALPAAPRPAAGLRIAANFREVYGAPENRAGFFLADPAAVMGICARITTSFTIRHDYAANRDEFTVFAYREVSPTRSPVLTEAEAPRRPGT